MTQHKNETNELSSINLTYYIWLGNTSHIIALVQICTPSLKTVFTSCRSRIHCPDNNVYPYHGLPGKIKTFGELSREMVQECAKQHNRLHAYHNQVMANHNYQPQTNKNTMSLENFGLNCRYELAIETY